MKNEENVILAEDKETIVQGLKTKIIKALERKDFLGAELYRRKIMDIDSMNLKMILELGGLIDEAKKACITDNIRKIWRPFLEEVGEDEFADLYYAMRSKKIPNGTMVARQGEFSPRLLFVWGGSLQLFYRVDGKNEVPVRTARPGDIVGSTTFFTPSVWTMDVRSNGVLLLSLSAREFSKLQEIHPELSVKLLEFCTKNIASTNTFSSLHKNRRAKDRKQVTGDVGVVLLDGEGKETKFCVKGELRDISSGGCAVIIPLAKKGVAHKLCGIGVHMKFPPQKKGGAGKMKKARIVSVREFDTVGGKFCIHVAFEVEPALQHYAVAR